MTTTAEHQPSIVDLMETPIRELDEVWLRASLQWAITLELSTIPPYACGLWSIKDPKGERDKGVHKTIREVVFDEMSHMGLVCNMLTTIGGDPCFTKPGCYPIYPGKLPGGVRKSVDVFLSGLSHDALDLYCRIEMPTLPIAPSEDEISIGEFYDRIESAFERNEHLIKGTRQVTHPLGTWHGVGNDIVKLKSLDDVLLALSIIKEQGEGTTSEARNPFPGTPGELAHYYAFREIREGKRMIKRDGSWEFRGADVAFPQVHPAARVPAGGWQSDTANVPNADVRRTLDEFNQHFSTMLRKLEATWQVEDELTQGNRLEAAIGHMSQMRERAQILMQTPLPADKQKTYCPEFRYVQGGA
ncbi:ferritin-like protein [Streptomyces sp. NPDC101150]|uniref:ferritin-like domain-containing protein n=1 Tax=Streptomyces sp. NPDC101150 TaxID=3366114 RepID=UPI00381D92D9